MKFNSLRKQDGFTLVETIIVVLLLSLVLTAIYLIFDVGLKSYKTTNEEVRAQANFRLVNDYLDLELKNSANATLVSIVDPTNPPEVTTEGAVLLYMKQFEGIKYVLYEKTNTGEKMIGYPLEGFSIVFTRVNPGRTVDVKMSADGVKLFNANILLENTTLSADLGASGYNGVLFLRYLSY